MRSERKKQIMTFGILLVAVLAISVGFAAFSTTLRIDSSASVKPNSSDFSVKFSTTQNTLTEAVVTPSSKTTSTTATNGVIDNSTNPTISNLSAEFRTPGEYVEYTFYARNEGQYLAYLNNINYEYKNANCIREVGTTAALVNEACEGIKMTVSVAGIKYEGTQSIIGHTLAKNAGEEVKVRIEYLNGSAVADGPFKVEFGSITLYYSTVQDFDVIPSPTLSNVSLTAGGVGSVFVPSLNENGKYAYDLGINKGMYLLSDTDRLYSVTGYVIYEKTDAGYTEIADILMTGYEVIQVEVDPGEKKEYVARVYIINSENEKEYSEYSNVVTIDHSL